MSQKFPIQSKSFARVRFVRSRESSVTTAWGVDWSDAMIARDLMQNFYDAHLTCVDEINVEVKGSAATISGKEEFDLNKLFYLASEKTEQHVGQYGEGFKAAIACLLRRHPDAIVVAQSAKQLVSVRLEKRSLGDSSVQPLVYDFFEDDEEGLGSQLLVKNVSTDLTFQIGIALSQFWHAANPLAGERIATSSDEKLSIYHSTDNSGHLFYGGLKRGEITDLPVLLICEKRYQRIEQRIAQDRDRKAFDDAVRSTLYNVWATNFFRHNSIALAALLDISAPLWSQGKPHGLLAAIASKNPPCGSLVSARFSDVYFASSKSADAKEQLRITNKENEWKAAGRVALPSYFAAFGAETAKKFFDQLAKMAEKDAERRGRRSLSAAETGAKEILEDAVQELAPQIWDSFGRRRPTYSVAETQVLLGQFKKALPYQTSQVFLAASVFEEDFATAIAVFLHEHAHIYGFDGDREFTDSLTWLIASVIRNRIHLDEFESQWKTAMRAVAGERKLQKPRPEREIEQEVDALSETDMRKALQMLPLSQIIGLVDRLDKKIHG